jgi:hypothetical protein
MFDQVQTYIVELAFASRLPGRFNSVFRDIPETDGAALKQIGFEAPVFSSRQ